MRSELTKLKRRVYMRELMRRKHGYVNRAWNADSYIYETMLDLEWRKLNARRRSGYPQVKRLKESVL